MFLSTYTMKVDKKGRISVPAQWRAHLPAEGFDGFIAFPSIAAQDAIDARGLKAFLALMEKLRADTQAASGTFEAELFTDGDNHAGDSRGCALILNQELMKLCQYFAYVEIIAEEEARFLKSDGSGTELWLAYRTVAEVWRNFAMKRIARPADIYPVFRELFAKREHADG